MAVAELAGFAWTLPPRLQRWELMLTKLPLAIALPIAFAFAASLPCAAASDVAVPCPDRIERRPSASCRQDGAAVRRLRRHCGDVSAN
jgi:hypothetical protein